MPHWEWPIPVSYTHLDVYKRQDLYNNGRYADKDLVKYMDVGATYYFNRNMSTYVDYKINLLDGNDKFYEDNGISTDNIVPLAWFTSSDAPARRFRRAFPHPPRCR